MWPIKCGALFVFFVLLFVFPLQSCFPILHRFLPANRTKSCVPWSPIESSEVYLTNTVQQVLSGRLHSWDACKQWGHVVCSSVTWCQFKSPEWNSVWWDGMSDSSYISALHVWTNVDIDGWIPYTPPPAGMFFHPLWDLLTVHVLNRSGTPQPSNLCHLWLLQQ